jgi:hypothetical protein
VHELMKFNLTALALQELIIFRVCYMHRGLEMKYCTVEVSVSAPLVGALGKSRSGIRDTHPRSPTLVLASRYTYVLYIRKQHVHSSRTTL